MTAPDPRLNKIEASQTRAVTDALFGDVLRIVGITYYFGADLQWHNARTGHVEQAETLIEEIEASEGDCGWLIPSRDAAYLLTELRKRDEALARVEALHKPVDAAMYAGIEPRKVQVCTGCGQDDGNWQRWPCPTAAAVTAAKGETK